MKKIGVLLITSLTVIILQQAIFSNITIFGAAFDAVFVYIICLSILREDYECVGTALLTGIIRDSFFPSAFGINTVVYLLVAYSISLLEQRMYRNSIFMNVFFTFVATMLKGFLYFGYLYIISIKHDFGSYTMQMILTESILNAIISIPMFRIVYRICNTEVMKREWKF
jgi:rod shape-determining protein MreD